MSDQQLRVIRITIHSSRRVARATEFKRYVANEARRGATVKKNCSDCVEG